MRLKEDVVQFKTEHLSRSREKKPSGLGITYDTVIEVIRISHKGEYKMKLMTYGEWLVFKGQAGYTYRAFERGFSQFLLDESEK